MSGSSEVEDTNHWTSNNFFSSWRLRYHLRLNCIGEAPYPYRLSAAYNFCVLKSSNRAKIEPQGNEK